MSRSFVIAIIAILLVALALAGWMMHVSSADDDHRYVPGVTEVTPEIELLQQYVRIDTSNPPGNEKDGALFLAEQLRSVGVEPEIVEPAPGRASLYARIKGRSDGGGLLLLHHIDVLPASPEGWRHPPFEAKIDLNAVWGRGTIDAKGIGVAHLLAFMDVARSGRTPERDVVFMATADEEAGGAWGLGWIVENRPHWLDGIEFALNEGGITELVGEKLRYFAIETGSKQFVELRAASSDRRELERARIALEPWFHPRDPDYIGDDVDQFFRSLVPVRKIGVEELGDVRRAVSEGNFWSLPDPYRFLTTNNIWMDGFQQVDGTWTSRIVLHNLPSADPGERVGWLREQLRPFDVELTVVQSMGPSAISPPRTRFWNAIADSVHERFGEDVVVGPYLITFGTNDSRFLRARGIVAYGVSPFLADFHQSEGIHGIDERVRLDWFLDGVSLIRSIVTEMVGANSA